MPELLDLSVYKEETADIRMTDGRLLHLRKPSEKLVIDMIHLGKLAEDLQPEKIVNEIDDVILHILENNADGLPIDPKSVENLTLDMKLALIYAYTDYATKLQSNPTSSSPGNRPRKTHRNRRS